MFPEPRLPWPLFIGRSRPVPKRSKVWACKARRKAKRKAQRNARKRNRA